MFSILNFRLEQFSHLSLNKSGVGTDRLSKFYLKKGKTLLNFFIVAFSSSCKPCKFDTVIIEAHDSVYALHIYNGTAIPL